MTAFPPRIYCGAAWDTSRRVCRFFPKCGSNFQIIDEALILQLFGFGVRKPQQVGRMHCHQRLAAVGEIDQPAAVLVDRCDLAEHALCGGRAERHDERGIDCGTALHAS